MRSLGSTFALMAALRICRLRLRRGENVSKIAGFYGNLTEFQDQLILEVSVSVSEGAGDAISNHL